MSVTRVDIVVDEHHQAKYYCAECSVEIFMKTYQSDFGSTSVFGEDHVCPINPKDQAEREHCSAAARTWLADWVGTRTDGTPHEEEASLATLIARERADAIEQHGSSCTCQHLFDQVTKLGKTLEASCPIHEWRLVNQLEHWQKNALEQTEANDRERASWQERLAQFQGDKDHLLDAIDKDATGLAAALCEIKRQIDGRGWVTEGRGPYSWDDDRYRDETRLAFSAVLKVLEPALRKSGTRANEAWRSFERGRIIKLVTELGRVRQVALNFGKREHIGMHGGCERGRPAYPGMEPYGPCDCGADDHNERLREALKDLVTP